MCGQAPETEVRTLQEKVAALEQHKEFLEDQLDKSKRRVDLLEVNITELWHRATTNAPLKQYLGFSDDTFGDWVEGRAGA